MHTYAYSVECLFPLKKNNPIFISSDRLQKSLSFAAENGNEYCGGDRWETSRSTFFLDINVAISGIDC